MKLPNKKCELVHWMEIFWGILFFVIVVVFILFKMQVRRIQINQTIEKFRDTLEIHVDTIDTSLESIEKYLYLTLENSPDMIRVESEKKDLKYFIAKQNIHRTMTKLLGFYSDISELIYYYPGTEEDVSICAGNISDYKEKQELEGDFLDYIRNQTSEVEMLRKGYDFYFVKNHVYLMKYYKIGNSFFGIALSSEMIFSALSHLTEEDGIELCLIDAEGHVVDSTIYIEEDLPAAVDGSFIDISNDQYLVSGEESREGDFWIAVLTKKEVLYAQGKKIDNIILLFFLIMIFIFFPLSISFIKRFLTGPIGYMVGNMQLLGNGNLNIRMQSNSRVQEYCILEEAFNHMSTEIKNLKIENYEIQIKKQKSELQYLQLQISPHFYLNALNIVYSLAQIQDYKRIQKLTRHLVNYSRYMFHDAQHLVTLDEELRHVKDYIEIQKMRFLNFNSYQEEIDERLRKLLIPTFVLQSFVENSMKYGVKAIEKSSLKLLGKISEWEYDMAVLTVRDNGNGYDQGVLEAINNDEKITEDSEKAVGIRNVKERLNIIYGSKATVRIYNDNGAVSEIRIPIILQE